MVRILMAAVLMVSLSVTTVYSQVKTYNIINLKSNQCLGVSSNSKNKGAPIVQWTCGPGPDKKWLLDEVAEGQYSIRNLNSGQCLSVSSASKKRGAKMVQWPCGSQADQRWRLVQVKEGLNNIRNENSGQCLAVSYGSKTRGASIVQWPCGAYADHQWKLQETPPVGGHAVIDPAIESNVSLHNVEGLIRNLPGKPAPIRVKGSFSHPHFATSYSKNRDHIQGIAWIRGHYILAHSYGDPAGLNKSLLIVGDRYHNGGWHYVGRSNKFPHTGGIQSCGNILAVSVEPRYDGTQYYGHGSEILFVDFTDMKRPRELPVKIERPVEYASAVGIAFMGGVHYVAVYQTATGQLDLYRSNGLSLKSSMCAFTLMGSLTTDTNYRSVNLLVDYRNGLYMAGMYRSSDGIDRIILNKITNLSSQPGLSRVLVKDVFQSPGRDSLTAGFRWGGGLIINNPNEIDALGVAPVVTVAGSGRYVSVKRWTMKRWVTVAHEGMFTAKFFVAMWDVNGKKNLWSSGRQGRGLWNTILMPPNINKVVLVAQHNKSGENPLWGNIWKDYFKEDILTRLERTWLSTGSWAKHARMEERDQ